MDCELLKENFLSYVDLQLTQQLSTKIDEHIEQCQSCTIKVAEEKKIQSVLRNFPIKPMSANFRARVLSSIRLENTHKRQHGVTLGLAIAVGAGLLIWLLAVFIGSF